MQEKSLIKKKILKFLDNKGISKYEFYKQTGITRGILDQNNGMSEENTAKFLAVYGKDINANWLFQSEDNNDYTLISLEEQLKENSPPYPDKSSPGVKALLQEKDERISAMAETIQTLQKYIKRLEKELDPESSQEEKEKPASGGQKRKAV